MFYLIQNYFIILGKSNFGDEREPVKVYSWILLITSVFVIYYNMGIIKQ